VFLHYSKLFCRTHGLCSCSLWKHPNWHFQAQLHIAVLIQNYLILPLKFLNKHTCWKRMRSWFIVMVYYWSALKKSDF